MTNGPFWARKWHILINSGTFLKFCTMKGANRFNGLIEKNHLGQLAFRPFFYCLIGHGQ